MASTGLHIHRCYRKLPISKSRKSARGGPRVWPPRASIFTNDTESYPLQSFRGSHPNMPPYVASTGLHIHRSYRKLQISHPPRRPSDPRVWLPRASIFTNVREGYPFRSPVETLVEAPCVVSTGLHIHRCYRNLPISEPPWKPSHQAPVCGFHGPPDSQMLK